VVQRFGKYLKDVPPGLHFKLPRGIDVATIVPVSKAFSRAVALRRLASRRTDDLGREPRDCCEPPALGVTVSHHTGDVVHDPMRKSSVVRMAWSAWEERVEKHIKQLHAQLHITPAEQPQWDQFAQVMRENARDMDQAFMRRAQQYPTMNAM
jgi:hypothetical protein